MITTKILQNPYQDQYFKTKNYNAALVGKSLQVWLFLQIKL